MNRWQGRLIQPSHHNNWIIALSSVGITLPLICTLPTHTHLAPGLVSLSSPLYYTVSLLPLASHGKLFLSPTQTNTHSQARARSPICIPQISLALEVVKFRNSTTRLRNYVLRLWLMSHRHTAVLQALAAGVEPDRPNGRVTWLHKSSCLNGKGDGCHRTSSTKSLGCILAFAYLFLYPKVLKSAGSIKQVVVHV